MGSRLLEGVSRLGALADELLARAAASREREQACRRRVAELEAEVSRLRDELAELEQRRALEATALALGPNSEDSRQARRLVTQLIREIDGCIALLRG